MSHDESLAKTYHERRAERIGVDVPMNDQSLETFEQPIATPRTDAYRFPDLSGDWHQTALNFRDLARTLERELVQKTEESEARLTLLNRERDIPRDSDIPRMVENIQYLMRANESLQSELSKKEQQLEESDKTLLEVLNEKQSLQSERTAMIDSATEMGSKYADLQSERDTLRAALEKVTAALSISRGQWYHSVNRDQCLEALNHSKSTTQ